MKNMKTFTKSFTEAYKASKEFKKIYAQNKSMGFKPLRRVGGHKNVKYLYNISNNTLQLVSIAMYALLDGGYSVQRIVVSIDISKELAILFRFMNNENYGYHCTDGFKVEYDSIVSKFNENIKLDAVGSMRDVLGSENYDLKNITAVQHRSMSSSTLDIYAELPILNTKYFTGFPVKLGCLFSINFKRNNKARKRIYKKLAEVSGYVEKSTKTIIEEAIDAALDISF